MEYVPLCDPWPVGCVDWTGVNPAATGQAVAASSEWLWALSGRQFGSCPVLLRPCRDDCPIGSGGWWWDGWSWPADRYTPGWLGFACGSCAGPCSCSSMSSIRFRHPVQAVTTVLIDGVELPASGYALYDGNRLVRVDGTWPACQDWQVPVSGAGAWSVTVVYGFPVPQLGELAMGEAAREFGLACTTGATCRLPSRVSSVVRQGVTQNFATLKELIDAGATGLPIVDQFIDAVNPGRIRQRVGIWNPDDFDTPRRPGAGHW
jgi:hypothetical protein